MAVLTRVASPGSPSSLSGSQFSAPNPSPEELTEGRVYAMDTATCSMKLARFTSRSERPAHS